MNVGYQLASGLARVTHGLSTVIWLVALTVPPLFGVAAVQGGALGGWALGLGFLFASSALGLFGFALVARPGLLETDTLRIARLNVEAVKLNSRAPGASEESADE